MNLNDMILDESPTLIRLLLDRIVPENSWNCAVFEKVANLEKITGNRYLSRLSITIESKLEPQLKKRIELYKIDLVRTKLLPGGLIILRLGITPREVIKTAQTQLITSTMEI